MSKYSESLCNYFAHTTYIYENTHVVMYPTPKEKTKAKKKTIINPKTLFTAD